MITIPKAPGNGTTKAPAGRRGTAGPERRSEQRRHPDKRGQLSVNGLMDDAGIWNVTLSQTQVEAMYNTEMVPGLQATDLYGQGTMAKLFGLYGANGLRQGRQPDLAVCNRA